MSGSNLTEGVETPPPQCCTGRKSPVLLRLKGTSSRKKVSSNERAWKTQKTIHHRPQCAKCFWRYSISKSGTWAGWTSPFRRFSASSSLKYDVTDAMLPGNDKLKVQCLRSLLFDLFETLQTVRA